MTESETESYNFFLSSVSVVVEWLFPTGYFENVNGREGPQERALRDVSACTEEMS